MTRDQLAGLPADLTVGICWAINVDASAAVELLTGTPGRARSGCGRGWWAQDVYALALPGPTTAT
ncbi:hypothetical protein [Streptomyces sp. NPDC056387]|uniref:hypothetical protein n=1 Tax=Streptomyces sp. NPDC056387 TaxID=3345803 RepID=UPI0035E0DCD2